MEAPKIQMQEKTIGVPVVTQGQVPTIQSVQKTVEMPQVQFLDRVLDASVVTQRHVPQETIDIPVPHMMEKTTEVMKPIPQERVAEQHRGTNR